MYVPSPPSRTVSVVGLTCTPRSSSSVIVTVVAVTFRPAAAVLPSTVSVSSTSSTSSSVGARVNIAVPENWFASIVSVKADTGAKSLADAVPDDTVTVTAVPSVRAALFSVPVTVTVVVLAPSPTAVGFTVSVTCVDAVSTSATVTVTSSAVTLLTP